METEITGNLLILAKNVVQNQKQIFDRSKDFLKCTNFNFFKFKSMQRFLQFFCQFFRKGEIGGKLLISGSRLFRMRKSIKIDGEGTIFENFDFQLKK